MGIAEQIETSGYIELNASEPKSTRGHAEHLGLISRTESLQTTQMLTPRYESESTPNTYSGNFGRNRFPFHSDLAHWNIPPRYIFLRCIEPDPDVKTELISFSQILDNEDQSDISRAHFLPRKRIERRSHILKLREGKICRWDSIFMEPNNSIAIDLKARISVRLANENPKEITFAVAGQALLIDNWNMVHSRTAIKNSFSKRLIERIYMDELY